MRTRNADTPKSVPAARKTPPAKKSASKTPPTPAEQPVAETPAVTPKSTETKRASATKGKQVKTTPTAAPEPAVEASKAVGDAVEVTPGTKVGSGTRPTRKVIVKRVVKRRTLKNPKSAEVEKTTGEESTEKECAEGIKDVESSKGEEPTVAIVEESAKKEEPLVDNVEASGKEDKISTEEEPAVDNVEESAKEEHAVGNVEESAKKEEAAAGNVEDKKEEPAVGNAEESAEESARKEEPDVGNVEESAKKEEPDFGNVEESAKKEGPVVDNVEFAVAQETAQDMEVASDAHPLFENVGSSSKDEDSVMNDVDKIEKSSKNEEPSMENEKEDSKDDEKVEIRITEDKVDPRSDEPTNMEIGRSEELEGDVPKEDVSLRDEKMDELIGHEVNEEYGEEELAEDDVAACGEAGETLDEELTAAAKERKIRKELEIFVGGLDRDATEEDVKKAFENVGEVVDVRMQKDLSTSKNKGYAFVRFAKKDQATRALAEMRNPVIHGKRCGTAPSEDNDTLFLGNICNTWTKEAIRQKLKDYGIESVQNITLVADPQREGLSRGFAFLEFSCHADAMLAYKRLQKPDVIFGHSERTAKVAFAEPLREPDPEVLAQVKSVFVDGLPPHWDEDIVREQFKSYGEIERIMLARNMSTARRKDFGFVDFATHEAALTCIDGVNNRELDDGNSKTKVRARLSNPLPKTQAVKGGMCGGFRIGHASGASFSKFGRGFARGKQPSTRQNFQHGRGFYERGRGQTSRMGFGNDHQLVNQYPSFRGRQYYGRGGRWDSFRGAPQASGVGNEPARYDLDRHRHGAMDRDRGRHMPMRGQPFPPEEEFGRPFVGRHFDDPYFYEDNARGIKRPFFADQDPDYIETSRGRPRLDYSDPAISVPGTRYRGAGSGLYSRDYYGYDYDGGAYSSGYGGDRPYGGRYYY